MEDLNMSDIVPRALKLSRNVVIRTNSGGIIGILVCGLQMKNKESSSSASQLRKGNGMQPVLILMGLSVLVDLLIAEAWWFGCLSSLSSEFEHLLSLLTHQKLLSSPCITVWTLQTVFLAFYSMNFITAPLG